VTGLRRLGERRRDELIALVGLIAIEVNVVAIGEAQSGADPPLWIDVLVCAAFALPLAWRRRAPFEATVAMMAVAVVQGLVGLTTPPDMAASVALLALMLFSVGRHAERRAVAGLAVGVAAAVVVTLAVAPGDILFPVAFFFVAPWAAGRALRNRLLLARELAEQTARAEAEREERAASAIADERARIARELHDVVAHSLTVMVIQAGAARRIVDSQPERVVEVAETIKRMGSEALDEMRRLVGVLHEEGEGAALAPQPTMADVESLVERARGAGLDVELEIAGERAALPAGIDLSAYRVIQEALTNTIKHARAARATVTVVQSEDALELVVVDDGSGGATAVPGSGQGLVGMRERVSLYGGSLEARPRESGGFEVRARFPLRQEAYA
jgi:signal transduction histidine kinase